MVIKVTKKSVYGVDRIYPACETSILLLELTGGRTFAPDKIEVLKKLGYELVIEAETV